VLDVSTTFVFGGMAVERGALLVALVSVLGGVALTDCADVCRRLRERTRGV
jgi:hypothetical protein